MWSGSGSDVTSRVRLRYRLIRTPLQEPAVLVRSALDWRRFTSPQFNNLRGEDHRMLRIMKRVLRQDSNCVDVGCHYGSMLSRMTRLAPRGRHVAFEAIPDKVRFLRAKFPDVDIRETALSDRTGEVTFWVNTSQSGFSGLRRHGDGEFKSLSVESARLDDALPLDRRFDLVKIDVEGAELLVLRGGAEFFRRDRPTVLFECGPDGPAMFGFTPDDLFNEVVGFGYSVHTTRGWLAADPPLDLSGFRHALEYPYEAFNFVAVAHDV
jgi:FkbM family methyltransferase